MQGFAAWKPGDLVLMCRYYSISRSSRQTCSWYVCIEYHGCTRQSVCVERVVEELVQQDTSFAGDSLYAFHGTAGRQSKDQTEVLEQVQWHSPDWWAVEELSNLILVIQCCAWGAGWCPLWCLLRARWCILHLTCHICMLNRLHVQQLACWTGFSSFYTALTCNLVWFSVWNLRVESSRVMGVGCNITFLRNSQHFYISLGHPSQIHLVMPCSHMPAKHNSFLKIALSVDSKITRCGSRITRLAPE